MKRIAITAGGISLALLIAAQAASVLRPLVTRPVVSNPSTRVTNTGDIRITDTGDTRITN